MNRKKIKPDQGRKSEPEGIPISDAGLNYIEKSIKKAAVDPEANKRMLRYVAMIRRHISDNDARRAVITTSFLDQELYETGINKPFLPRLKARMAAGKGGKADKKKKGVLVAIKEILPQMKIISPGRMWKLFQSKHGDDLKAYTTADLKYEIYFDREDNLLFQKHLSGKLSSIKFKTFEKYFYEVLKENPQLRH